MNDVKKILLIRFSSIGDVLLTTPVLRAIATQLHKTELHVITKKAFVPLLENNPHISRLHSFVIEIDECIDTLQAQQFDLIIDLHNNLRSRRLTTALGVKVQRFNKLNFQKWLAVYFKLKSVLPDVHVVDRYLETVNQLGIQGDGKGLDMFLESTELVNVIPEPESPFIALVVGGSYYTKQIPYSQLVKIIEHAKLPVVLMGGAEDTVIASKLCNVFPHITDAVGKLSLQQSAGLISKAAWVITSDTGLMHIASAFNRKIISVWGNTIPEFGMGPYRPHEKNRIIQNTAIPCRPCSKLGHHQCPLGHFKCMNDLDFSFVSQLQ